MGKLKIRCERSLSTVSNLRQDGNPCQHDTAGQSDGRNTLESALWSWSGMQARRSRWEWKGTYSENLLLPEASNDILVTGAEGALLLPTLEVDLANSSTRPLVHTRSLDFVHLVRLCRFPYRHCKDGKNCWKRK